MFQFPWFASCTYGFSTSYLGYPRWVPPYSETIIEKSMKHNLKSKEAGHFITYLKEIKEDLSNLPNDTSIYDSLIKSLNDAKSLKEVGEVNQSATKSGNSRPRADDELSFR